EAGVCEAERPRRVRVLRVEERVRARDPLPPPIRWTTKSNSAPAGLGKFSSLQPRAFASLPLPPVIATAVLPVSENGPSTVIWPPGRNVVQLHSQVLPTTMRTQ